VSASALLGNLAERGVRVRAIGSQLAVRPSAAVTPALSRRLRQHRVELIRLLDPEVSWRFDAMRPQIPTSPTAPIPMLVARPSTPSTDTHCASCGDRLPEPAVIGAGCCRPCVTAKRLLIEHAARRSTARSPRHERMRRSLTVVPIEPPNELQRTAGSN